jgi:hypothetical protein
LIIGKRVERRIIRDVTPRLPAWRFRASFP